MSRRSYSVAWSWYVRGHVVSFNAERLIVQFLAASCGKSKADKAGQSDPEGERAPVRELPGNDLALERVHDILDEMSRAKVCAAKAAKSAEDEDPEDEAAAETKAVQQSHQVADSMQITASLWARGS